MRPLHRGVLFTIAFLAALAVAGPTPAAEFPLEDGDIWVMAGDSITAQHLHSNYFEAFCFARYPNKKFAFRNSGVSGHTIPTTLKRFEYDIAAWKPTVVSVELGMNDKGGATKDQFIANMGMMVGRIREIKARPVIFAASPVNNGETTAKMTAGNQRLHEFADALKEYSAKEKIPYADQFHRLFDVWGKNKPKEALANSAAAIRQIAQDDSIEGVEHLRAFLKVHDKNPNKPVSMGGDAVHPGPPGQLMMAAALLKELGADGFVSTATVDAVGKVAEAKRCKLDGVKNEQGTLTFERLDERLPFPIPEEARAIVAFDPTILEMSQYLLKVTGLKAGNYQLKINGVATATLSAKDLEAGINLTAFGPLPGAKEVNPIAKQSKAILDAVVAKEALVNQWRALSAKAHAPQAAPELKDQLGELKKKVEDADAKIREAAKPQLLKFELTPVK